MGIGQFIDRVEERQDLTVILKESDDRLVKSRQFLIRFIASGVMGTATVEDIAATVAALVLRDTLLIGEAEHLHHQRSLGVVAREGGRTILRMGLIGVQVCRLIAVST